MKKRIFYTQLIIGVLGPRGIPRRQVRKLEEVLDTNLRLLLADIKKVKPRTKDFTFKLSR